MEKYGTPGYRAPEFATATAALNGWQARAAEAWAVGVTALQFASGMKHIKPKQLADVLQALSLRQDNVLAVAVHANEHQ